MNLYTEALDAIGAKDYEKLLAIERELENDENYYAIYSQIFNNIPYNYEESVILSELLKPHLQEAEFAYNFSYSNEEMIFKAAQSCIDKSVTEFSEVIVMSLASRSQMIEKFIIFLNNNKKGKALLSLFEQLSVCISHYPQRYDQLIQYLSKTPDLLEYLLVHKNLTYDQIFLICENLDVRKCSEYAIELLCQVPLSQQGIQRISTYIYEQLKLGNIKVSNLLLNMTRSSTVPKYLLAQSAEFLEIFAIVCEQLFLFPHNTMLDFVEWLTEIYRYCNTLYSCNAVDMITVSIVEQLEQYIIPLVNQCFSNLLQEKLKQIMLFFTEIVKMYELLQHISTYDLLQQFCIEIDEMPFELQKYYYYICLQPNNYSFEESDMQSLFDYLISKTADATDFELISIIMKLIQTIGEYSQDHKFIIRLTQTEVYEFCDILQNTLITMKNDNEEYYNKNIGSKIEYTICNYFEMNDEEFYTSFELPAFSNTEYMIPELLSFFSINKMSNFEYLHILFKQQEIKLFLDSADLFTLDEFAEFAAIMADNIIAFSPLRLSEQCIERLYQFLFENINQIFEEQIDENVVQLINKLLIDHFEFASEFFECQYFVDYILESALAKPTSMELFKALVYVNPLFMKKYAYSVAKTIIFCTENKYNIEIAVDLLEVYCNNKNEIMEEIFGGFHLISEELESTFTDTDICDLVECEKFDVKEIIRHTLNLIYE